MGGAAENFAFYISNIALKSGSSFALERSGVTAIVGGNNVGKSTLLREIIGSLTTERSDRSTNVLQSAVVDWQGSDADFLAWASTVAPYMVLSLSSKGFSANGQLLPAETLLMYRSHFNQQEVLGPLFQLLVHFATARDRFHYVQPTPRRGSWNEPPSHPLHRVEQDPELLRGFQAAAKDIFNAELTLDRLGGNLFFRVGKPELPAPPIDDVDIEYIGQLLALPGLEGQGDGMQSALSLLLPVVTSTFPLVLVDEPEAFLHPPQARKLGATLAKLAHSRSVQLIVATHDRHFLTGLLDADEASVSVIRLSRDGDSSVAKHLDSAKLRQAWGKASIRHSNLLDGLFHKLVVIAENERDCQFFAAALEELNKHETLPLRPHDVLFVPSAGKGNIPGLAEVLIASGVPVVASPDLDILNSEPNVERLYRAFGGDWSGISDIYKAATAEFKVSRTPRTNRQVEAIVSGILSIEPGARYSGQTKSDVSAALGVESEWKRLKDYGMAAFKSEHAKAQQLMGELAAHGIVPVHVGELERFAPQVQVGKGDAWLEAALAAHAHRGAPAQDHLRRILAAGGFTVSNGPSSP